MKGVLKKRISVQTAIVIAALMALSGYALAVTVTQTQRSFEAINGGVIRVTNSIQVTDFGVKNMIGGSSDPTGTTKETAVQFGDGGENCWFAPEATPNGYADGDFALVFLLKPTASATPNTVFLVSIAIGEAGAAGPGGNVYVKTGAAPYDGYCAGVAVGLGTSFSTPFVYRLEVKVAP